MANLENINSQITTATKPYNKSLVIAAGILALVLVVLLVFLKQKPGGSEQNTPGSYSVSKNELVSTEIPSGFPENLPVEVNSKVLQNYEATTNDGRLQSTRSVTTAKSAALAIKTYTDFFENQDWKLIPSDSASTALMLKGSDSLVIEAKEVTATERSITLTLTQSK